MSVDQKRIIDFISLNKKGDLVTLTVSDHLEWLQDNEHMLILQNKLNDYLMFVESGEIYKKYPQYKGLKIRIDVACKYPPVGDGIKFLELVKNKIENAGFDFTYTKFKADSIPN
jgi:hypothetical protein